jgi:O-acetyl-ADP-ribose deacetylase (regulator of RNase III)
MSIEIVKGDLLECSAEVICHQCNCVSRHAAGLAKDLFEKYPWADCYKNRGTASENGNYKAGSIFMIRDLVQILRPKKHVPLTVINIFGQVYPGKPRWGTDSKEKRKEYFGQALETLSELLMIDPPGIGRDEIYNQIAFPYKIGCGLAGGNWDDYYAMLEKFASKIDMPVVIYKK